MEAQSVLIELKSNSKAQVEDWINFINHNKKEALSTLKNEHVVLETFFQLELNGKDYLICYMRAQSMEYAVKAVKNSVSIVDEYHQNFKKETWAKVIPANLILDLSLID